MKQRYPAALTLAAMLLTACLSFVVPASAADDWNGWGAYGFSGTAIANDDPTNPASRLIGGVVTTILADHRLSADQDYSYTAKIILDTEGVALRTRVCWVNTESGYREVVDMKTGIAVYPMDESIDVAVATAGGVERYSFPTPAGYDILAANEFTIRDSGESVFIEVCGKTIAVLSLNGTRQESGRTYVGNITVTNGDGYVYGRLSASLVPTADFYVAYSSEGSRALVEVTEHTYSTAEVTATIPAEQETSSDWVPETAPPATEAPTDPVTEEPTEPASDTTAVPDTTPTTDPVTETPTTPPTEPSPAETDAPASRGCGGTVAAGVVGALTIAATAAVLRRKERD